MIDNRQQIQQLIICISYMQSIINGIIKIMYEGELDFNQPTHKTDTLSRHVNSFSESRFGPWSSQRNQYQYRYCHTPTRDININFKPFKLSLSQQSKNKLINKSVTKKQQKAIKIRESQLEISVLLTANKLPSINRQLKHNKNQIPVSQICMPLQKSIWQPQSLIYFKRFKTENPDDQRKRNKNQIIKQLNFIRNNRRMFQNNNTNHSNKKNLCSPLKINKKSVKRGIIQFGL